eukprot:6758845-Alexandrium_andersonii.AAC.1
MKARRAIKLIDSQGPRIAMLAVKKGPRVINLYTAYAPQAARPLGERQGFYEDLDKLISRQETK